MYMYIPTLQQLPMLLKSFIHGGERMSGSFCPTAADAGCTATTNPTQYSHSSLEKMEAIPFRPEIGCIYDQSLHLRQRSTGGRSAAVACLAVACQQNYSYQNAAEALLHLKFLSNYKS